MILPFLIAMLATWIGRHQDHVIRYLHEENRILKAKLKGKRIQLTDTERRRLAVLAHPIDRKDLKELSIIATPDTLERWYRRLVVETPSCKPPGKSMGRPPVAAEIEQLVVRMANENPRWGYRRIQGALSNLGYHIDNTTVCNILRRNHIDPAPIRGKAGMSWSQFIKLHWEVLEVSGVFEAQLSVVAHLWSVLTQFGRNLNACSVELLGWIHYGALSLRVLVAQQGRALWSGCLRHVNARCHVVFGGRWRVPDGVLPTLRLASTQPVTLQIKACPIEQDRSPPGANRLDLIRMGRHLKRGRGAPTSRFVTVSNEERESGRLLGQRQQTTAVDGVYAVAA